LEPVAEGESHGQHVAISLEYLPDFSEEYSIHVRSGLGSANVQVTLADGWNLTQINQNLDSQTDEILKALSEVAGKIPAAGFAGEGRMVVKSSNVPLGYYEAVIGLDPLGRKQLYGWRYTGFLPFAHCPMDGAGLDCFHCGEVPSPLFGLVFRDGTLTFCRLDEARSFAPEVTVVAEHDPHLMSTALARLPAVLRE
jgi:hypothetical protein